MICLQIRFVAGRFHGNGWYSAHNEGIPEWPPSPWRLLRTLVSAACADGVPRGEVEPLLDKLRELPKYRVPSAVTAHTRHYMPDTDDANHKKAKVFDAFVVVEGGAREPSPVTVMWEAELLPNERELLVRLCRRVPFLGRAESWAELSVVDEEEAANCFPDEQTPGASATNLLALSSAEDLAAWSNAQPKPKKGQDVPRGLWDVLTFSGERYRREGWSSVPGTRLVRYVFQNPPFRRAPIPSSRKADLVSPTVARFAIRSSVLPRVHEALAIGERLRQSVMSNSKRVSGDAKPVFSGHGQTAPDHRHAMYLSASDDARRRGFIDHLVVCAKDGFEDDDIVALQGLRRLWGQGGHDLELILVGLGQPDDFGGMELPNTRLLGKARVWQSLTPFVPPRHPKVVRGVATDTIEDQIARGCQHLIGVAPLEIQPFRGNSDWTEFRRRRYNGGGSRGPDHAVGARLVFESPVSGPIALGYGAHFGLGVFVAAAEFED